MVGDKGQYIVENTTEGHEESEKEPAKTYVEAKPAKEEKKFNEDDISKSADVLPIYPGGNVGFQSFLNRTSLEMARYVPRETKRTYVMMEFVIDKEGKTPYAKVIRGGNEELNNKLEQLFENMPSWTPATKGGVKVAVKLKQSIEISR